MNTSFYNLAERMVNAEEAFIAFAMRTAGLSREQAIQALTVMRKGGKRAPLKLDPIGGQFTFSHGLFAEPDVLRNAASVKLA